MKATRQVAFVAALISACLLATPSYASSGGGELIQSANNELGNNNSLQRGARNYMNYCVGCHSLKYVRYNRLAEDLGLDEEQLKQNLIFGADKINSNIHTAMTTEQAKSWFNAVPPDLSLTGRSRGADWIYSYLKSFYVDENRTFGVNNMVLEGSSMPNVLWELQGVQKAKYRTDTVTNDDGSTREMQVFDHFELAEPGIMNEDEFDAFVRDTTNFLDYVGEPMKLKRQSLGKMVMGFLAILWLLAYALKVEYWRDVH